MHATLTDQNTGMVKQVKVGYSWTFFFFSFWVPIIRGDWKNAIIALLIWLGGLFTYGIGSGLFVIVYAFFYNKNYTSDLISNGYLPSGEQDKNILVGKGYVSQEIQISKFN